MHSYIKAHYCDAGSDDYVLILVLMEDALVQFNLNTKGIEIKRLNPCFNGRCTRTLVPLTSKRSAPMLS